MGSLSYRTSRLANEGREMSNRTALRKVARVAMGDLIGVSEAPEGIADNYPFNAPKYADQLPEPLRSEAHRIITYVYRQERMPTDLYFDNIL